ncbi:TerB family tellurite resistance protein [Dyadobacter sp. BHUBP1]|uniref:TerB family tellurite resistance protein n=1 Tax=Dyadobacter sp. BHUBP1 TaxID=3424178 RepID=UPI003D32D665
MKKIIILMLMLIAGAGANKANAQANEIAQLILNIEKLRQFKQILEDLKKGYDILFKGYTTIKNLSEGNFKLHKAFLDALWEVNPKVKNYYKVAGIVDYQLKLLREQQAAYNRFRQQGNLTEEELRYLSEVYENLIKLSLRNLDELASVVTADKLRMSDDERLKAIDGIYADMEEKLVFLRHFNGQASVLAAQRAKDKHDAATIEKLQGLP